ncbi:MAG: hypothetical protein K6L81_17655 [Agarilytica sp.]
MNNDNHQFPQKSMCERCNKREAISFSVIRGEWKFTCACTQYEEQFFIYFEDFFDSASANVKWLSHLTFQPWVDWQDFGDMMYRFREAIRKPSTSA